MKAIPRFAVPLAVAAVAAVGLTGCDTSPGAAALVGDQRISTSTLQHTVDAALADPQAQASLGSDRASFTRQELGRLISNRVVAAAAAAHGVTVTDSEVQNQIQQFAQQAGGLDQLYQQAAQGGVPRDQLTSFIRYYVLQNKLGDALVASQPVSQADLQAAYQKNRDQFEQVHAAHILVKTKAQADRILATVRSHPGRFAALAKKYSIDTGSKSSGGDLGFAGAGQFVKPFSDAIFAAKPGSYLEVHTQYGWHVVHVIAHRTVSLAQATPQLKADILKTKRSELLQQALSDTAKKLGVHVNPRYGQWSAATATVVPPDDSTAVSSPSPSPGA